MPENIQTGISLVGDSFIVGRQNIEYYGIKDMDVLIEDTSAMSSQYFKIVKMPNQFEGGKNAIFLMGDDVMLERDTEILVEVLDANGDNIFVEVTEKFYYTNSNTPHHEEVEYYEWNGNLKNYINKKPKERL